jgi:hypothetical protein
MRRDLISSAPLCQAPSGRLSRQCIPFYARLIHSDWSTSPRKRWAVAAVREKTLWRVATPSPAGDTKMFLSYLLEGPCPTLAGFDFPIGLPESYGQKTPLGDFCSALDAFGSGLWSDFYNVAEAANEISIFRPFYPQRSSSTARQVHLIEAHGCSSIEELRRRCEQATVSRRAACSLFWTLGGNQVGKAAISGWREIISPARRLGAQIWPFEGSLEVLAKTGGLVVAETYPAEAYGHVGVRFAAGESKRRQNDRAKFAPGILIWARSNNVLLAPDLVSLLDDGFGPRADGEDAFDAVMGLFGMIEVIDGRRPEGPLHESKWEGWILGQSDEHGTSALAEQRSPVCKCLQFQR